MKIVHALIALVLSAFLAGLVTGLAGAGAPEVAAAAPVNPGDTSGMPRVSAITTPTPITGAGLKGPSATARASPAVKYLQARPVATIKASPTAQAPFMTPAQSYGIYGRGGAVPSPPAITATPRPVPSGSPTPVPGGFTPRFPGEPGYGKSTPSPAAVKSPLAWPKL